MVHLRRCSTKYNLFYTFTKDCFILEGWQGDDEDDDVSRYLPHTCGCRQSGQSGQCDGRDSVLASCNKMTVRQTLEIHIGLMTWLHAKLILNNHFAGNYKLVFYKTFFLVLKSRFDWLENIQNNGGLVVWSLLSVIFVSIWLMMFKNFFTLFKILSAETFFPPQPFVSSIIALSRPLETVNQIDSKKKKVILIFMCLERCLMYLFRCRCRKDIKEIVLAPQNHCPSKLCSVLW